VDDPGRLYGNCFLTIRHAKGGRRGPRVATAGSEEVDPRYFFLSSSCSEALLRQ
jgi:hypothetical protein